MTQQRVLSSLNSVSRLVTSQPKSHCEKIAVNSTVNADPGFDAGCKTRGLMKTSEDDAVANHKMQNFSTGKENCRPPEADVCHKISADLGTNTKTCRPVKVSINQAGIDYNVVPSEHSGADPVSSAVQQSTGCNETVSTASTAVGEKNSEAVSEIGRLSAGISAEELRQIYSRIFHRR